MIGIIIEVNDYNSGRPLTELKNIGLSLILRANGEPYHQINRN